jgi:hypothetical protein
VVYYAAFLESYFGFSMVYYALYINIKCTKFNRNLHSFLFGVKFHVVSNYLKIVSCNMKKNVDFLYLISSQELFVSDVLFTVHFL